MLTSSATATSSAPAAAPAPEGPSDGASLALHAGGLVVVLPAALVLVVGVPACSARGTTGRRALGHDSTSLEQAQSPLNAGMLPPGLALPQARSRSPARAPTFELAAVVGGVPVLLVLPVVPRGRFVPGHL